jgi:hypothetical protein
LPLLLEAAEGPLVATAVLSKHGFTKLLSLACVS